MRGASGLPRHRPPGAETADWNLAADAEVNDDLLDLGLPLLGKPVTPAALRCPKHRLAEGYFRSVKARRQGAPDCGSGAHGRWRD